MKAECYWSSNRTLRLTLAGTRRLANGIVFNLLISMMCPNPENPKSSVSQWIRSNVLALTALVFSIVLPSLTIYLQFFSKKELINFRLTDVGIICSDEALKDFDCTFEAELVVANPGDLPVMIRVNIPALQYSGTYVNLDGYRSMIVQPNDIQKVTWQQIFESSIASDEKFLASLHSAKPSNIQAISINIWYSVISASSNATTDVNLSLELDPGTRYGHYWQASTEYVTNVKLDGSIPVTQKVDKLSYTESLNQAR